MDKGHVRKFKAKFNEFKEAEKKERMLKNE